MEHTVKWKMNDQTKWYKNPVTDVQAFDQHAISRARQFIRTIPGYAPTPLYRLSNLAKLLGVKDIFLKDESFRFGLNAFKVLGGSYAIANFLAEKLGMKLSDLPFDVLTSDRIKSALGDVTFATTTDGNHGRAVAWTAHMLRQKSVVNMPKGSSRQRFDAIAAEGAKVTIMDCNYDEAVRITTADAQKYGWVVVQDTAWEGYEDIPLWIMQGYGTMADEAMEQLVSEGGSRPTHVFAQAGVGSLAGMIQGFFKARYKENAPKVVVVESDKADCYYRSAVKGDGKAVVVDGDLNTLMAGLACGEANSIAYGILRDYSAAFVSCSDYVSARGIRVLGNPLKGDLRCISGESGAVTAGLLSFLQKGGELAELREALELNENSTVMLFSTEGNTDTARYRNIVWNGDYPTFDYDGAL
jgi:diaminopropionate ammonia-lyase